MINSDSCGAVAANGHCQGLMVGSGERTRDLRYNHSGFMRKMVGFQWTSDIEVGTKMIQNAVKNEEQNLEP